MKSRPEHRQARLLGALLIAGLPLMLASCSSDGTGRTTGILTTDSAGVTIVENHTRSSDTMTRWTIGPSAILDLGGGDTTGAVSFSGVAGARLLEDGRVVIADRGSKSLVLYNVETGRLSRAGGPGEGPSEFTWLAGVWVDDAGRILALDVPSMNVKAFTATGEYLRSVTLPAAYPFVSFFLGRLSDQYLALHTRRYPMEGEEPRGPFRDSAAIVGVDTATASIDTVISVLGIESYLAMLSVGGNAQPAIRNVLFGAKPIIRPYRGSLYVGDNATYEIRVMDGSGRTTRIIRKADALRPATVPEVDRANNARREQLENMATLPPDRRTAELVEIERTPYRDTLPAFETFLLDAAGNLWVQQFSTDPSAPQRFDVFDAEGLLVAVAEAPPGLRVTDISGEQIIGIWRDSLDVEHVRAYSITRSDQDE